MLQQTQVSTVIPYYRRFIARFPTAQALADTSEDEVLHLWSGLGYYTRARNLYKAAKMLKNGQLSSNFEELLALPGIGRSTAGAILSFGFGLSYPILDGNVKRVLSRAFAAETADELWKLSRALTPELRIQHYNQAIMDLGALVCTRATPKCSECPFSTFCIAYKTNRIAEFPVTKKKPEKPIKKTFFLLIVKDREVLLEKRHNKGVWKGLWCFPEANERPKNAECWPAFRHIFTHYSLDITPVIVNEVQVEDFRDRETLWYNLATQQGSIGLPVPVKRLVGQLCERFIVENSKKKQKV